MNLQTFQKIVSNINSNPKSKIKIAVYPTFMKEIQEGPKVLNDGQEMYNTIVNWLKLKEKEGIHFSTEDFHKDEPMKGNHWRKIKHATFSRPKNRFVLFYFPEGNKLHILGATSHRAYEGNHRKQVSLADTMVKRLNQSRIRLSESTSGKTYSKFITEINNNRTRLLAPDPTREDLKRISDENIQRILKKAKANPRDLTQVEKDVLYALGREHKKTEKNRNGRLYHPEILSRKTEKYVND